MTNNNELYIIEWIDSYKPFDSTWEYIKDIEEPVVMVCVSVGWIEKETKDNILIIPHISDVTNKDDKGHGSGAMVIPEVAILKKTKLKYKLSSKPT